MTRERKAEFPLAVRQAGPGRWWRERGILSLIGALLVLTAPVPGARAIEGQPDWVEDISVAGAVTVTATGVSRSEANDFLEGFGLTAGAVADPEVRTYGSHAFQGVQEVRTDWAVKRLELNGKFSLRQSTEVFGQAMTVTSVISSDGLLVSDDRGGSRTEKYRKFPAATCYRGVDGGCGGALFDAARDAHGSIVEFVRNRLGLPVAVRFGETLLLRYKFTPPLPEPPLMVRPGDPWREPSSWDLIDIRTSEVVIDSIEAAKVASERSIFAVGFKAAGELLRVESGQVFVAAQGRLGWPYGLVPLDTTSDIWRIVYASGDMSRLYKFRVDYTDVLVRVEIKAGEYGRSIVVEAPRSGSSEVPISFLHPGAEMLTDAMRSGTRLLATAPLDAWLQGTFEKESLPIVLTPFHNRGIAMESGVVREAAGSSAEHHLEFGPGDGCEERNQGIVCTGGASEVIGEDSPYPW